MFKLQVVLVPPSAQNVPLGYGLASSTAESSQLIGINPMTAPRNQETTLPYAPSGNTSLAPYHFAARLRKFLHFTKSANTLLELSAEIDEKCAKMYPYVDELEILSLQDSQGCDLDPDFLVKDVFTMDNVVRVIIKNELEIDDSSPVSSYRAAKRKKLNSGIAQSPPSGHQQSQVLASTASSGILNIAKKRPAAFAMRHSTNNNMRVSTPLAHQIYPLPNSHDRMVSNNSEDEDDDPGERSFLPPPAQPQSPPIRISSGMDTGKKIKSMIEDDTVSRSEIVDPDKLRQQRLLSGTPVRSAMTPNRVTLTGQRVVSEHQPPQPTNAPLFTAANGNRKNSFATTRITSGRLSIPEPKIAEVEKELKEGPSSPSSMLPPKPDRIPMKKPLQETEEQPSDDDYSSEDQETDRQVRAFIQRQTSSIADNNGSPTKNSPLSDDDHVHLAELPQTRPRSVSSQQRKTSLEAKVEHKLSGGYPEEEPLRIDNFSEDEDSGAHDKEQDRQWEGEIDRQWEGEIDRNRIEQKSNAEENDADSNDTANETVVVRGNLQKPAPTNSINKEELLKFMEGDYSSAWNNHSSKGKPYTTVLHKDIDNSKPDPRNILPEKMTRSAAKRAAQLLAGTMEHGSGHEPAKVVEDSSSDSSSGIESDLSQENENRISVAENNATKTLNIHPLKETVIEGNDSTARANALRRLSKSDSERSEGTSFGSSTDQEQDVPSHVEEQVGGHKETLPAHRTRLVSNSLNTSEKNFSLNQPEKPLIHISPAATSPNGAILNKENDQLSAEKELTGSIPKSSSIVRSNNLASRHNTKKADTEIPTSSSSLEKDNPKAFIKEAQKDVKSGETKTRKTGKEKQKQIEKESKQKAREDAKKAKEEEAARKRREREEKKKLKQEEMEKKRKLQQEEKKRLQAEMEKKREEEFKKQQELLERRKQEFYEKKRQEELERQRREEEGRKKEADIVKRRLEELGRKKREEMERKKQEDEEKRRQEELARRRQEEAERKRQEEQERKKQEKIGKKRLQEESEKKKQEEEEKKRLQEESEKKRLQEESEKKKQEEQEKKRLQEEAEKKRLQEEAEKKRLQEEAEKKKQEEQEKKRLQKEAEEKKRIQEEQQKKRLEEEAERNKEEERKRQEEAEKKRLQEEEEKRRKANLEKKRQEEEQEKERQAKLEKKKQDEELQQKRRTDLEKKKQQEELQKKRQAESERKKLQDEVQRRKHADQEKKKQEQVKKKPKALSVAKPAKSPAAVNGSDKLKELKARFTSSKTYVPASSKGSQQGNKGGFNEDTESSDEGSSTEYSSSSSEEEEEPSSKKSRRKVVDTPKGSLTTGRQKPAPKELGGLEAAPQSTQRSDFSSQSSQNQVPVTRMMEMSSPSRSREDTSANSSILAGLPKKIRPSLSSLSDLVSRGVPEVKEKSNSSQNSASVHPKKVDTDSDADESDDNNDSETESDSSDSDSDDSDSGNNSFISAKTANTALGKKKKGNGGFASLLRDSQKK